MNYPVLTPPESRRETTNLFLGLNRNDLPGEGELADMENLTSDRYPVLASRPRRGIYAMPAAPSGMIAKDSLCYADGEDFIINGNHVHMHLSAEPKTMVSMGAYVIILPDRKYINTADLTDFGNIDCTVTVENPTITPASSDGTDRIPDYIQPGPPESPAAGALWVDTSGDAPVLKVWSAYGEQWTQEAATYLRIDAPGIGSDFRAFDGVTLSGSALDETELVGSTYLWNVGEDFLLIPGFLLGASVKVGSLTVSRKMPEMDFVVESENRLWGCRYGLNSDGEFVNELYASKLGDFRNFGCYMGLSTDSYTVSLGSDGVFTGACSYLGFPLFFKENCIHRVYGSYPAAYRLQTTQCRGVRKGSEKSLVMVGEVLYYHSATGICAYDGSLPMDVSQALGRELFHSAVAGTWRGKYYVSMADEEDNHSLYVYDPRRGLWHREDDCRAAEFCACRGELFFIDHRDGAIKTVSGQGTPEEGPITWSATTGPIGAATADHRYLRKLTLDVALAPGSTVTVEGAYDESPDFKRLGGFTADSFRRFTFPVRPRRCAVLRLRISGTGEGAVYGITRTTQKGSDVT